MNHRRRHSFDSYYSQSDLSHLLHYRLSTFSSKLFNYNLKKNIRKVEKKSVKKALRDDVYVSRTYIQLKSERIVARIMKHRYPEVVPRHIVNNKMFRFYEFTEDEIQGYLKSDKAERRTIFDKVSNRKNKKLRNEFEEQQKDLIVKLLKSSMIKYQSHLQSKWKDFSEESKATILEIGEKVFEEDEWKAFKDNIPSD